MLYTKKVMEHFRNPHNFGKMKDADAKGRVGNMVCGDVMDLYIKVGKREDGKEFIKDIKFETFGCATAIASSSMITDLAKGKTLEEALEMTNENVVEALGGLPPLKVHCSVLSVKALHEAIYNFYKKNNRPISKKLEAIHQAVLRENAECHVDFD